MPIFQDEDHSTGYPRAPKHMKRPLNNLPKLQTRERRASGDSTDAELRDGPISTSPENPPSHKMAEMRQTKSEISQKTSDRGELMERLKRGESPTWIPNSRIESLFHDHEERLSPDPKTQALNSSPLLPSAEFRQGSRKSSDSHTENSRMSSEIERPRSALHSGDFTQKGGSKGEREIAEDEKETIDPSYLPTPASWIATTPPRDFTPFQLDPRFPRVSRPSGDFDRHTRAPSLSSSLSSFVLMAPTSPLVQSESNEDLSFGPTLDGLDIGTGLHKIARRHTLQTSHSNNTSPQPSPAFNISRPLPNLRRDNSYPYQAHQPRRSLASTFQDDASVTNSPPFLRSRRPSCTSESSPLQLASMVGSYEESILRGRMSTTPSKPLDFVAKIGVLGRGKCKPFLRCPAHVTLPFPAVFYSYGTTSHSRSEKLEDGPSPYVGQIDLENGIKPKEKKRKKLLAVENQGPVDREIFEAPMPEDGVKEDADEQKNASTSPRAPPGGSYRIPEKGQIQIIIKNPNNTAIKLFLVPYDLAGMASGTKTFIRQRIYSAGPIIDGPLPASPTSPKNQTPTRRPILRYLIHLHICCPSKNRFYLYKTIRVVFANRVPDGKETLRSEIQLPEPRFSPWKPARESVGTAPNGPGVSAGSLLTADKAFRRRSSGFPLTNLNNNGALRPLDTSSNMAPERKGSSTGFRTEEPPRPYASGGNFNRETPISPIPFSLDFKRQVVVPIPTSSNSQISSDRSAMSEGEILSPTSQGSSLNSHPKSTGRDSRDENSKPKVSPAYDKLSKGDVGYGGNAYFGQQNTAESLLAKRLKNLGISSKSHASESGTTTAVENNDEVEESSWN